MDYNDRISECVRRLKTPNIGIEKITCIKIDIELKYNVVKNT